MPVCGPVRSGLLQSDCADRMFDFVMPASPSVHESWGILVAAIASQHHRGTKRDACRGQARGFGLVFVFRLLFIQVLDPKWKDRARRITHTEKSIQPPRGLIYDRNGKLLVSANQVYDIMITPREIGEIDTLALCSLFSITKEQFDQKIIAATSGYNVSYKASLFIEGMSKESYAKISNGLKKYNGFEALRSSERGYPFHNAAHILGYIRKISKKQ